MYRNKHETSLYKLNASIYKLVAKSILIQGSAISKDLNTKLMLGMSLLVKVQPLKMLIF